MQIKTSSDIKHMYQQKQPDGHFFDRSTMRFFGDSMSNYYVPQHKGKARIVEFDGQQYYALERRKPVKHGLASTTYFHIDTFESYMPS